MEQSAQARHAQPHASTTAIDPVCGMHVDPAKSPHRYELEGETY